MSRDGTKAAVFALGRNRRIFFGRHKADVVNVESINVDCFLDQIAVLVADVLELGRGNTNIEHPAGDVAKARGLQPGLEGLANDLFLKRRKNL